MRRSVSSAAVAGGFLALAIAGPGFSQINTSGIPPIQRMIFNLAEAYPATSGDYTGGGPGTIAISPNGCWIPNPQAISGIQAGGKTTTQTGGLLGFPTQTQTQTGGETGQTPVLGTTGGTVQAPTLETRCNTTLQPILFNAIPSFGRTGFAVAGVLCLPTAGDPSNPRLNVNVFAVRAPGDDPNQPCYVQMARLTKQIPGSIKCPDTYGTPIFDSNGNRTGQPARTYVQFGATPSGIRTWWALSYTQPGTKFILDLTVVCGTLTNGVRGRSIHVDRYTWQVVANADTLPVVINLLHTNTIGTTEVPCIVSEQAYCDLMAAAGLVKLADTSGNPGDRTNAIQTFEGLLGQYCLFLEFVPPTVLFPGPIDPTTGLATYQPPGDLGDIPGGSGAVGIVDTEENPCCCKMLVDIERIGQDWGVSQ